MSAQEICIEILDCSHFTGCFVKVPMGLTSVVFSIAEKRANDMNSLNR